MAKYEHILDNRQRSVVDYLRSHLSDASGFRLIWLADHSGRFRGS